MRSDLRSLRERIRQVEAGGHRDTPLRRAYNRKLRALKGGCGAAAQISGGGPQVASGPDSKMTEVTLQRPVVTETGDQLVY